MSEFLSIASFNQRPAALHLAERLQAAGFSCQFVDDSLEQTWHLFQLEPHAQFQVRVDSHQTEQALAQIQAWAATGDDQDLALAIRCPECASTRVVFPQFSRRTLIGAIPAIAATAGIIERDYFCETCHYTWPAEPTPPATPVDLLNWPVSSKSD